MNEFLLLVPDDMREGVHPTVATSNDIRLSSRPIRESAVVLLAVGIDNFKVLKSRFPFHKDFIDELEAKILTIGMKKTRMSDWHTRLKNEAH